MKKLVVFKALIFDFDGLILDTEGPIFQSWQEAYRRFGGELSLAKWATVIGTYEEPFDPFEDLQEQIGRRLDPAEILPARSQREAALVAAQQIRPGVEQYLQDAHSLGMKVGLASSSSCQWVTGHLNRLRLIDYFHCIRGKDDVKITKPDPALYLSAASGLGVLPEQAIALEDSPNGVLAARRAGMFAVAVPNDLTRQLPLDHADWHLDSLADLPLQELIKIAEQARSSQQG